MTRIMEFESKNPRLPQKQKAKQVGYSDSTIKRYRDKKNA